MDATHPSCILPIYYYDRVPYFSCASGELWHVALVRKGDMIYCLPEFEGWSNLDRELNEQGILFRFPKLLGISFVMTNLNESEATIYSIRNCEQTSNQDKNPCRLSEYEIEKLIYAYSDAYNDSLNSMAYKYSKRT